MRISRQRIENLLWSSKKKKICTLIFLILLCGIVGLEILSRLCPLSAMVKPDCMALMSEYVLGQEESIFAPVPDDLGLVVEQRTKYVSRLELNGANGVACFGFGFVADDLPDRAKRHVAIHEAIHLMGEHNEAATNYRAAFKEPVGFVQTIVWSIGYGFSNYSLLDYPCACGRTWGAFKIYFLNIR